jgi:hypothetical protein
VPIAPRDFITFPPARCHQNQRAIHPGQFYEWVRANTPKSAGAILIGGNRFRAVGTIKALERGPCAAGIDSKPGWALACPAHRRHARTDCRLRPDIRARIARLAFARALLARADEVVE